MKKITTTAALAEMVATKIAVINGVPTYDSNEIASIVEANIKLYKPKSETLSELRWLKKDLQYAHEHSCNRYVPCLNFSAKKTFYIKTFDALMKLFYTKYPTKLNRIINLSLLTIIDYGDQIEFKTNIVINMPVSVPYMERHIETYLTDGIKSDSLRYLNIKIFAGRNEHDSSKFPHDIINHIPYFIFKLIMREYNS